MAKVVEIYTVRRMDDCAHLLVVEFLECHLTSSSTFAALQPATICVENR